MEDSPIVQFTRAAIPRLSQIPRGGVTAGLAIVVALLAGLSMLYQVQPEEVGVVLRFLRQPR